jgi:uncharacterized protein YrrD
MIGATMDRLFQDRQGTVPTRVTALRGLPLVDPAIAQRIGVVVDVLVDPIAGRIAALDVQTGPDDLVERVLAESVRRIGQHAVMLAPGHAGDAPRPGEADRWVDTRALVGMEVLADSGDRVGSLADAIFDPDTLDITAYELDRSFWERWLGGGGLIRPEDVVSCSFQLMIVTSARRAPEPVFEEPAIAPRAPLPPGPRPPADTFPPTIHEDETTPHPVVRSAPPPPPPPRPPDREGA